MPGEAHSTVAKRHQRWWQRSAPPVPALDGNWREWPELADLRPELAKRLHRLGRHALKWRPLPRPWLRWAVWGFGMALCVTIAARAKTWSSPAWFGSCLIVGILSSLLQPDLHKRRRESQQWLRTWLRGTRRTQRFPICPYCGYDHQGTAANRCPECGGVVEVAALREPEALAPSWTPPGGWEQWPELADLAPARARQLLRMAGVRTPAPGDLSFWTIVGAIWAAMLPLWFGLMMGAGFTISILLAAGGSAVAVCLVPFGINVWAKRARLRLAHRWLADVRREGRSPLCCACWHDLRGADTVDACPACGASVWLEPADHASDSVASPAGRPRGGRDD